jgi:integrase
MAFVRKIFTPKGAPRWQARWSIPGPSGTPIEKARNFKTQKDAKDFAAKMLDEGERRGIGDPQRHDLRSFLKTWLAYLRERSDHAPTTLAGYEHWAALAARHLGHVPLTRLTPHELDQLYAKLLREGGEGVQPLARRSVLHVHRILHTALAQARRWRLISHNPATDAKAPTVPFKQARGFTKDEITRLLAAATDSASEPQDVVTLALLLTTGVRRSELLGLTWDAVDLETGALSIRRTVTEVYHRTVVREIPKSKQSRRTLSIPPAVIALLREQRARINAQVLAWGKDYMRDPFFCFPGPAGEPWRPLRLTARLRRLCRRAGVAKVQPVHGWRHAAATLMIADGADVKTTQTRLGHSSPAITLALYTDRIDERDRAAGERLAGYLTRENKAGT